MQFEVASGKLVKIIDFHSAENPDWHMAPITAMVCNHDRSLIVSGDRDGNIKFWDPATGKILGTILTVSQGAPVNSMQFNPAGDTVADSNRSSTIYLWDVKTRRKKRASQRRCSTFQYVRHTPNGLSLITWTTRAVTPTRRQRCVAESWAGQTDQSQQYLHQSQRINLATGGDKEAHVYDAATGRINCPAARRLGGECGPQSDNRWIATASHDKTIKPWNAATGKIVATFEGHIGEVNTVAFSLDGKTLVMENAGEGRLWMCRSGRGQHALTIES